MVRPPPGLATSVKEVASRALSGTKGGASKLSRPALKFQRPLRPQARNASTSSGTASSSEPTFLQLLYQGVFTSVRSAAIPRPGPYTGQRLAARPPSTPFRHAGSSSIRARPQASRFGPTPRPALYPTQTSQLGLGAARKFSSSGYAVFENVVHNAPLALRALADQGSDGLDNRKWRRIRREIRRNEKTDIKGKGAIDSQRMKENISADFAQYFSIPAQAAEPVSLLLTLDPEMTSLVQNAGPDASRSDAVPSSSSPSEFDASYRLLPPSVLSVFQSYSSHVHRLRGLVNRLSAAGILDDPSMLETGMYQDATTGTRIWKVTFHDAFLTRGRLESILRGRDDEGDAELTHWESKISSWNGATPRRQRLGQGEGQWWSIEGGDPTRSASASSIDLDALSDPPPSTYLHSPAGSSAFETPRDPGSPMSGLSPVHSLVLPDPSSFELSPPLSPSLEPPTTFELSPPLSPSLEPPTTWDPRSPDDLDTFSRASELEFAFQGPEGEDFDAIDAWSLTFEDETSSVDEWSSTGDSVVVAGHEAGQYARDAAVQHFLDEVDNERERLSGTWR
ncbi:hypothetical protein JCM11491_005199 [Sporobolomyces phaffii]